MPIDNPEISAPTINFIRFVIVSDFGFRAEESGIWLTHDSAPGDSTDMMSVCDPNQVPEHSTFCLFRILPVDLSAHLVGPELPQTTCPERTA